MKEQQDGPVVRLFLDGHRTTLLPKADSFHIPPDRFLTEHPTDPAIIGRLDQLITGTNPSSEGLSYSAQIKDNLQRVGANIGNDSQRPFKAVLSDNDIRQNWRDFDLKDIFKYNQEGLVPFCLNEPLCDALTQVNVDPQTRLTMLSAMPTDVILFLKLALGPFQGELDDHAVAILRDRRAMPTPHPLFKPVAAYTWGNMTGEQVGVVDDDPILAKAIARVCPVFLNLTPTQADQRSLVQQQAFSDCISPDLRDRVFIPGFAGSMVDDIHEFTGVVRRFVRF